MTHNMTRRILVLRMLTGVSLGLAFCTSAAASMPDEAVALTTEEILKHFSGVRDAAEVQDQAGTLAVNDWYKNGTFVVRWSNHSKSGEVTGKWWAENDKRCIEIDMGLPERKGVTSCSPVYRRGDLFLSMEPDGRIHGIHRLTPLPDVAVPAP